MPETFTGDADGDVHPMLGEQKMKVLRVDASAKKIGSVSRALMDRLTSQLGAGVQVVVRDLSMPLPQVDEEWILANNTPFSDRSANQHAALGRSDVLIDEVEAADLILIGLPVYNFSVPASLKAWIDQVCRVKRTFEYTENGPVGLLKNKRAIVFYVSGGTPMGSGIDFASGYFRHILGFIGINDVEFVNVGQNMFEIEAISQAERVVDKLSASLRVPAMAD